MRFKLRFWKALLLRLAWNVRHIDDRDLWIPLNDLYVDYPLDYSKL